MKVVWVVSFYNSAHLLPLFFKCLKRLSPQPDLYLFTENNSTDRTLAMLANVKAPHEIIRLWFAKDAIARTNGEVPLALTRQTVLARLRQLKPDYAFFCDSDVLVHSHDAIPCLISYDYDLVGASVARFFPEGLALAVKWQRKDGSYQLRTHLDFPFDDTIAMVGFGLVCIKDEVLQDKRINFYPLLPALSPDGTTGNDFGYCIRMKQHGYKIAIEGLVDAEHIIYDYHHEVKPWTVGKPFMYV